MHNNPMSFFRKDLFRNYLLIASLWFVLMLVCGLLKYFSGAYNNYAIFTGVFRHAVDQVSLFGLYPAEYGDMNHYGVLFSCLIAPFALMPTAVGICSWLIAGAGVLFVSVRLLPVERWKHAVILWFVLNELFTAACMQQFNIMLTGFIVLSFVLIERDRNFWAAMFIVLGTLTKLYGIVGLAFFFFSRDKMRLILSLVFWGSVFYLLPMVLSSYDFVNMSYVEWFESLASKNSDNLFSLYQNVSLLGMVRKISHCGTYSDLWLIVPGLILFALPYLRVKQYANRDFRLMFLASTLLFTVLFSTGSESSTYIIALTGVGIWITSTHSRTKRLNIGLLVFAFLLTSLSPTDLFPRWVRMNYILPYALKALPCALIWFKICYEQLTCDFADHAASGRKILPQNAPEDIVLPACNPPANWGETVCEGDAEIVRNYPGRAINLIVVNDGSQRNLTPAFTDRSLERIPDCRIFCREFTDFLRIILFR